MTICSYNFPSYSVKSVRSGNSFSPSPRQSTLTTPPSNQGSKVVIPSNHRQAGFEIVSPETSTNDDSLNKSSIISEEILEDVQKSDFQEPDDVQDFDLNYLSDENSFDLKNSDKLLADPIEDLSPWKPVARQSRPRAGAVCESVEKSAHFEKSSESHEQLHEGTTNSDETDKNHSPSEHKKSSKELNFSNKSLTQSKNPFDEPTNQFDQLTASLDQEQSKRDRYFNDVVTNLPETDMSASVPSGAHLHTYMSGHASLSSETPPTSKLHGHNRSKSDCHPKKVLDTTPPSQRKKYAYIDPYSPSEESSATSQAHSLSSLKEGESESTGARDHSSNFAQYGSKKSSLASLDETDSPLSSRQDAGHSSQDYSSGESGKRSKQNYRTPSKNSSQTTKETWENFFSSGEAQKRRSHDKGYSSSEASQRLSNSRDYVSSEGSRHLRTTGSRVHKVHSHDDIKNSRKLHSDDSTQRRRGNDGSSSEERRTSIALYKDEDPTYIESNLNLFLDIDIFNLDKKEEFRMIFRTPIVQYGHTREMQALVVVSNLSLYIFQTTAPEK